VYIDRFLSLLSLVSLCLRVCVYVRTQVPVTAAKAPDSWQKRVGGVGPGAKPGRHVPVAIVLDSVAGKLALVATSVVSPHTRPAMTLATTR
jgi:hypothetical protein